MFTALTPGAPLTAQRFRPGSAPAVLGYTDQAHLAREVRDLAGVPLTRLLPTIVGTRIETLPVH